MLFFFYIYDMRYEANTYRRILIYNTQYITVPRPIILCSIEEDGFCSLRESGNCQVYNAFIGCSQCNSGSFKKSYNHPCVDCQSIMGDECAACNDFTGCRQCKDSNNFYLEYDTFSELYYCKPQPCLNPENLCRVCNNGYCSQCMDGYTIDQSRKFCL